ncbi:NDP-hexose 2,3-dehydratase family protein [Brumicola pallidula]|uniref:Response regulator receiver domain-containing protein n=1 Tax=Brumicola pallidula DSM 14239 = ACAM 615 TaxID=1121922 RepID=K6ZHP5_9ALTE|nr:NDP-hexose 2,3-dehydratase family protein [Glaciecola pallidula]GAC29862.1 response regulator receiver domain-containing protein [Glaciecola pallidula DSM 14239 = ACAM 615]
MLKDDFQTVLASYRKFLGNIGDKLSPLRLESHVESLKDWSQTGDLSAVRMWFEEQQSKCTMTITDIRLEDCNGWTIDPDTGWFKHSSGEFFYVQGIRVGVSSSREVENGWDQPIITQAGYNGGLLGIIRKNIDDVPHYLIQAKAEPGNPDKVQISPCLQATFSNLKQAHGGRKPKLSEFFESPAANGANILFDQWMSEDGGRLHLKRNKGMLAQIADVKELDLDESFRWISLFQIKQLISENSWINPHVRGIISHL